MTQLAQVHGQGDTAHSYAVLQDDSSSSGPFEGPEKLLELWFAPSVQHVAIHNQGCGPRTEIKGVLEGENAQRKLIGLRRVQQDVWKKMLDLVKCKVLSVIEGQDVDAYLLSESSMFVWPHKLILKTCGTTTLLLGLKTLLEIAKETCGLPVVWRCFYSRKTFMFPERQLGPHKTWTEEVAFLDKVFDGGSAYTVGKMNGDHWMLYMTSPLNDTDSDTNKLNANVLDTHTPTTYSPRPPIPHASEPDSTLEILMSELSSQASTYFFAKPASGTESQQPTRYPDEPVDGHEPGFHLLSQLGLNDSTLFGEDVLLCDAFLFSPCGFSANMISSKSTSSSKVVGHYATIHVTPEQDWSYASFECNLNFSGHEYKEGHGKPGKLGLLVGKVLNVFQPKRMSMTLFISQEEDDEQVLNTKYLQHEGWKSILKKDLLVGYKRTDRIVYEFEGYDLVFATFERL